MRYDEIICESNHGDWPHSHGTPSLSTAKIIMQQGLEPQTVVTAMLRQNEAPKAGYVYLTPHVQYALNYVMGFRMNWSDKVKMRIPIEGKEAEFKWVGHADGFYGFMFVIYASTIIADLQPDEDVVGSLYNAAVNTRVHWALDDILTEIIYQNATSDPDALARFVAYVETVASSTTRAKLHKDIGSENAIAWASKIGKTAVGKMDATTEAWLLQPGSHAGSASRLMPDECWRFDRRKTGWVEPGGSNFFELA